MVRDGKLLLDIYIWGGVSRLFASQLLLPLFSRPPVELEAMEAMAAMVITKTVLK